jgi:hypothetical protein
MSKYFVVFDEDRGNKEDCSTYYCKIVLAKNKADAIRIVSLLEKRSKKRYDAIEYKLLTLKDIAGMEDISYTDSSEDDDSESDTSESKSIDNDCSSG